MQHNPNHDSNPFMGISQKMTDHLKTEVYYDIKELGEINEIMEELEHKAKRRMRYIPNHMKNCGECLSEQIKSGMLIELPDYWQLQRQSGGGRYPKLHYQVN